MTRRTRTPTPLVADYVIGDTDKWDASDDGKKYIKLLRNLVFDDIKQTIILSIITTI